MKLQAYGREGKRFGRKRNCPSSIGMLLFGLSLACACTSSKTKPANPNDGSPQSPDTMADTGPSTGPDLRADPDSPATAQDTRDDAPTSTDAHDDAPSGKDTRDDAPSGKDARDDAQADLLVDTHASLDVGEAPDLARFDGQRTNLPIEIVSRQTVRLSVRSARAAWALAWAPPPPTTRSVPTTEPRKASSTFPPQEMSRWTSWSAARSRGDMSTSVG
jgi:hypothetical protein